MIATVRVFLNALIMAARTGVGAIARESKARRPKNKFLPNFIKRFMKYAQIYSVQHFPDCDDCAT
jgi:hypothetical protein